MRGKGIVEATFDALNTLFCQHVAGYTGSNTQLRGDRVADEAAWTVPDLQDLLDEWLLAGWARRPHDALRDPYFPRRVLSPNDKYAALVAAAGYLPVTLTGEDYLELLPAVSRAVNDYGIQIDYRTYDAPGLGPYRRQHSGNAARRGLYEVHYDPYDLTRVFVRTTDGWVTAPWTHLPMVAAPFADFTWRHARRLTAQAGRDDTSEAEVARVLDELLTRAQAGPPAAKDKASARIAARTRVAAAHRPPVPEDPPEGQTAGNEKEEQMAEVIPLGVFDARAVAEKWPS
jgi:putative transposase